MLPFKPKLAPTLFTIPSLIILIILGSWQVQRLHWKEGIIEQVELAKKNPPIPLPQDISLASLKYKKLSVEGTFDHTKEIHLYTGKNESISGEGYHLFTPFHIAERDAIVMVDRGWVPESKKEQSARPETLITGQQKIVGFVTEGQPHRWFYPANDTVKNVWVWQDIAGMEAYVGQPIAPFILMAVEDRPNPSALPKVSKAEINIRNDHLGYAITWYGLAIALVVIYVVYHRKP